METLTALPFAIPFHNQLADAENYAAEGYATLEEGLFWTCRSCGIASVRMVIDGICALRGVPGCPSQAEVLRRGLALEGYRPGVGWVHRCLVQLAAEYGIRGESRRGGTAEDVCRELRQGRPCIVSVSPHFSGGQLQEDGTPMPRGGHLVVALGYYRDGEQLTGLLTHHPSCFPEYGWPEHRVEAERFAASFSGNYMVFEPQQVSAAPEGAAPAAGGITGEIK